MTKVNCKCGNQISDVADPCRNKGWLVSDITLDEFGDSDCCVNVITNGVDVWECENCGSIAFGNNKDRGIVWYTPNEPPAQTLMQRAKPATDKE